MTRKRPPSPTHASPPADEQVRSEWLRRIEAEYHSAASTQQLTLWLTQLGVAPEIIKLGLRVAADELDHAQLCAEVYREAGGQGSPQLQRETLGLPRSAGEPLERDVLRVAVEQFCLGETVAVRIFSRMRAQASVPSVRGALDRILRDEVVHRDFGWTLLEWLLTTPMADIFLEQLGTELPAMRERLREGYGGSALAQEGSQKLEQQRQELAASRRAWGLLAPLEYLEAVEETVTRDYAPRFERLKIAFAR